MTDRLTYMRSASLLIGASLVLGGCASFPTLRTAVTSPKTTVTSSDAGGLSVIEQPRALAAEVLTLPKAPPAAEASPREPEATSRQIEALFPADTPVSVAIPAQPVPQFLDTVFGDLLKVPYSLGPNVSNRAEIITLRSTGTMSQRNFMRLVQTALKDYGLRLYVRGGGVAVLDDNSPSTSVITVLRSRSGADTPEGARTVIQYFQLEALEASAVQPLLMDVMPSARAVKITPELVSNSLVIAGTARDVQSVVNTLRELDKPVYAGAQVARIQPVFWTADAFAGALETALTAEGYKVSRQSIANKAIMILSMTQTNQVLVFVNDPALMERVQFWAKQLDQPATVGDQKSTFVYEVRNTDAQGLGALVTGQGSNGTNAIQTPVGVPGTPPVGAFNNATGQMPSQVSPGAGAGGRGFAGATIPSGGAITIDAVGNRILFTGTAQQFAGLRALLEQLDVPPAQVMIDVTVAEVQLTDQTQLGLEWFFTHAHGNSTISGGTEAGLGLGTSGLNIKFTGPDLRAAFNAFASNNKVNILSRPRLVARSGTDAQINVGTDIPIVTSQAASGIQSGGSTSVLQSVQYRQTGVILKIKPVVYGDSRIDLEISQEVSSQAGAANAAIVSPSILDRSVQTKISLVEGSTSVLGGLISNSFTKANSGIPFVKDIPIIGSAFRTDTINGDKDELVILVTPFIIRDADQMSDLAGRLSGEMNEAYRVGRGESYTLTGIATGHNLGFDLPSARPEPGGGAIPRAPKPVKPVASSAPPADIPPAPATPAPTKPAVASGPR